MSRNEKFWLVGTLLFLDMRTEPHFVALVLLLICSVSFILLK